MDSNALYMCLITAARKIPIEDVQDPTRVSSPPTPRIVATITLLVSLVIT